MIVRDGSIAKANSSSVIGRQSVVQARAGKDGAVNEVSTNGQLQQLETAMSQVSELLVRLNDAVSAPDAAESRAADDQKGIASRFATSTRETIQNIIATLKTVLPQGVVDKLTHEIRVKLSSDDALDSYTDATVRVQKMRAGTLNPGLDKDKAAEIFTHAKKVGSELLLAEESLSSQHGARGLGGENIGSGPSSAPTANQPEYFGGMNAVLCAAMIFAETDETNIGTEKVLGKIIVDLRTLANQTTENMNVMTSISQKFAQLRDYYKGQAGSSNTAEADIPDVGFNITVGGGSSSASGAVNGSYTQDTAAGVDVLYNLGISYPVTEQSLEALATANGGTLPSAVMDVLNASPVWASLNSVNAYGLGFWSAQVLQSALQNPNGTTSVNGGQGSVSNSNVLADFFNNSAAGTLLTALNATQAVPTGQRGLVYNSGELPQSFIDAGGATLIPGSNPQQYVVTSTSLQAAMQSLSAKKHTLEAMCNGISPVGSGSLEKSFAAFGNNLNSENLPQFIQNTLSPALNDISSLIQSMTQLLSKLAGNSSQVGIPLVQQAGRSWLGGD